MFQAVSLAWSEGMYHAKLACVYLDLGLQWSGNVGKCCQNHPRLMMFDFELFFSVWLYSQKPPAVTFFIYYFKSHIRICDLMRSLFSLRRCKTTYVMYALCTGNVYWSIQIPVIGNSFIVDKLFKYMVSYQTSYWVINLYYFAVCSECESFLRFICGSYRSFVCVCMCVLF